MKITSKDIVIKGVTVAGKTFRPSDWAERLSSALSTVGSDNRMHYCPYVRPIALEGVKCVLVAKEYEQRSMAEFRFLMDFAHDNDLQIIDGADFGSNGQAEAAA